MEIGFKQARENSSSSSGSSATSLEKRLINGTISEMDEQRVTIEDVSDFNDDSLTMSSIPGSANAGANLTTIIEKHNSTENDNNNSNLSHASETDILSAQLALKELMDVNGIIKDSTKLRVIAALQTIMGLQQEVKELQDKVSKCECQQTSSGASNNNNQIVV